VSAPRVCLERRHKGDDDSGDHDGQKAHNANNAPEGTAESCKNAHDAKDDSASHDDSASQVGLTAERSY